MGLHMLIAESRQVQRQMLYNIYASCPLVGCIDEATNGEELGEKLATIFPDFVVVHQSLITDILLLPKGHFVIVATEPDKDILIAAYNQGARGYFLDNPLPPTTFLITCLELQGRQCSLGPTAASWLLEYIVQNEVSTLNGVLTAHEREILALWNTGLSSTVIGEQLCITNGTVKKQLERIRKKLREHNLSAMIRAGVHKNTSKLL